GLRQYCSAAAQNAAVSRTVLVSTPSDTRFTGMVRACSPSTCLPRVGLSPTRPLTAAGMRIDPPPSLACAMGTAPDATSAADPPEEAPTEYSVFHGFLVGSRRANSVLAFNPNSGSVLLPSTVNPALSSCLATRPCRRAFRGT